MKDCIKTEKSAFVQGYVCAIATITSIIGEHTNEVENKEVEIWKPVLGYEGCYEVSNLKSVRSVARKIDIVANGKKPHSRDKKSFLLKQNWATGSYVVGLSKNGEEATFAVETLYKNAFQKSQPAIPTAVDESFEDLLNKASRQLVGVGFKTAIDQYGYPTLHEIVINTLADHAKQKQDKVVAIVEQFIKDNDCWQERYTDLLTKIKNS